MGVREETAKILENNRGKYISGEEIAEQLGCSRNAVWKAVRYLSENGYDIRSKTRLGYILGEEADIVSENTLMEYLDESIAKKCSLSVYKTISSTNTMLKQAASEGAPEWTVYVAEKQTAGRGRFNRPFSSEIHGIYFSILLRPKISASESLMITTAAAVSVCEAIETVTGKKTGIKWVNDVFIDGKKCCGILTEAGFGMEGGFLDYAVLGIGINIREPDGGFDEELKDIACAVLDSSDNISDARSRIAAEVINSFHRYYEKLTDKEFLEAYKKRSIVIGKDVCLINDSNKIPAKVMDIDDECRLIVRLEDGTEKTVSSGEVSLRFI